LDRDQELTVLRHTHTHTAACAQVPAEIPNLSFIGFNSQSSYSTQTEGVLYFQHMPTRAQPLWMAVTSERDLSKSLKYM
jgi:hypothetical protein